MIGPTCTFEDTTHELYDGRNSIQYRFILDCIIAVCPHAGFRVSSCLSSALAPDVISNGHNSRYSETIGHPIVALFATSIMKDCFDLQGYTGSMAVANRDRGDALGMTRRRRAQCYLTVLRTPYSTFASLAP